MIEARPLGRSGLVVSALCFGCGSVGGLMVRGEARDQREAVAAALEAGVRYFDTAPSYGDGRSEEALGRALRDLKASPLIGTKFRLRADEPDVAAAVRRSLDESLRRLGRERVDLLQLHSRIASKSGDDALSVEVALGPVADALDALVAEGRIGAAGFTGLGEPAALHRVASSGRFRSMQTYVNALNPSAAFAGTARDGEPDFAGLIARASAASTGVLAIRTLAAGALAGEGRHANAGSTGGALIQGTTYVDDVGRAARLGALATDLGLESAVELGIRFALGVAGVSAVLVGFSDAAQVRDAIRFVSRGPLSSSAVDRIIGKRSKADHATASAVARDASLRRRS